MIRQEMNLVFGKIRQSVYFWALPLGIKEALTWLWESGLDWHTVCDCFWEVGMD
jgi:hypothetical protein